MNFIIPRLLRILIFVSTNYLLVSSIMYAQPDNIQDGRNNQEMQEEQPLPDYGEVEGQKILMRGLDYSLLQKQKKQTSKKGFLENIKQKISNVSKKIDMKVPKLQAKQQKTLDQQSKKLILSLKQLNVPLKPLINSSTFYLFDTNYHFGSLKPQVITKRQGKMNKTPEFIKISESKLQNFTDIMQKGNSKKIISEREKTIDSLFGKQKTIHQSEQSQQSSDNIFGSDDEQHLNKHTTLTYNKPLLFKFGQKLSLGVKDQEIFHKRLHKQNSNQDDIFLNSEIKPQDQPSQQPDKYAFMRKKVKKTLNQNQGQDHGYGQCYFQTGPTFEQIKQAKNQGVSLWGDLKEPGKDRKDRKPNIGRQYEKVKKIIDQKYKKTT